MSGNVRAIPEGYQSVTPDLALRDAARAIAFYERAFGAREVMRFNTPDGKIGHAEIQIGNSIVMLCDESPQGGCASPASLGGTTAMLFLYVENVDATFRHAVRAGATVVMPVADMFWGDRSGQVQDPFGHRWQLATRKEALTKEQIGQRAQEFFAGLPKRR